MSNNALTNRLAEALGALPFAEPILMESDITRVKVMCRVAKGAESRWAKVVEKLLRAAEKFEFQVHICRLYFLHNGAMVYGWHVGVDSPSMEDAVNHLAAAIRGNQAPKPAATPNPMARLASMGAYSPPLEADAKGNPVVSKQLESMPFTGMENRTDRNLPSPKQEDGRGGGKGVLKVQ